MQEKIKVVICTGTTCYVLGGSQLLVLDEMLPDDMKSFVEIEGTTCLNYCKDQAQFGKPPYVKIGEHLVGEATPGRIVQFIRELLNDREA